MCDKKVLVTKIHFAGINRKYQILTNKPCILPSCTGNNNIPNLIHVNKYSCTGFNYNAIVLKDKNNFLMVFFSTFIKKKDNSIFGSLRKG